MMAIMYNILDIIKRELVYQVTTTPSLNIPDLINQPNDSGKKKVYDISLTKNKKYCYLFYIFVTIAIYNYWTNMHHR